MCQVGRQHGVDAMPMPQNRPEDLWDRISNYGDPKKCWEWSGNVVRGYGQITINYKKERTHRLAFKLAKGEIPDGMFVCHSCDNKLCCNPDHLWLGTTEDNMKDMVRKGRLAAGDRHGTHTSPDSWVGVFSGENNPQSIFTEKQVVHMFELEDLGYTVSAIAEVVNGRYEQVRKILRGKRWPNVYARIRGGGSVPGRSTSYR